MKISLKSVEGVKIMYISKKNNVRKTKSQPCVKQEIITRVTRFVKVNVKLQQKYMPSTESLKSIEGGEQT